MLLLHPQWRAHLVFNVDWNLTIMLMLWAQGFNLRRNVKLTFSVKKMGSKTVL